MTTDTRNRGGLSPNPGNILTVGLIGAIFDRCDIFLDRQPDHIAPPKFEPPVDTARPSRASQWPTPALVGHWAMNGTRRPNWRTRQTGPTTPNHRAGLGFHRPDRQPKTRSHGRNRRRFPLPFRRRKYLKVVNKKTYPIVNKVKNSI